MESCGLARASGETEVIADSVPDYPFVVGSQATVGGWLGVAGIQRRVAIANSQNCEEVASYPASLRA
jgi:hypothetical protein